MNDVERERYLDYLDRKYKWSDRENSCHKPNIVIELVTTVILWFCIGFMVVAYGACDIANWLCGKEEPFV